MYLGCLVTHEMCDQPGETRGLDVAHWTVCERRGCKVDQAGAEVGKGQRFWF